MNLVAFDTETHLIQPGLLTPKLVCVSVAYGNELALYDRFTGTGVVEILLQQAGTHLVGHNVAYDLGVLCARRPELIPLVFRAYEQGRIWDTKVRQELLDIASGRSVRNGATFALRSGEWVKAGYSLAGLAGHYLGKDRFAEKTDADVWRMRYHELEDVPLDQWPAEATRYAKEDAEDTLAIFLKQGGVDGALPTEPEQVRAAWALHLMSVWGVRTDATSVADLEQRLLAEQARLRKRVIQAGILVPKRVPEDEAEFHEEVVKRKKATKKDLQPALDGSTPEIEYEDGVPYIVTRTTVPMRWAKDSKKIEAYTQRYLTRRGMDVELTATGRVSTAKDTLKQTGSHLLDLVADGGGVDKVLGTYVPVLKDGTQRPINARFNVLVNSGRTSCSEPNLQNLPSGRKVGGTRECFVPRDGYVFVSVDYDTLELRALAQVCLTLFGKSEMAASINANRDLHSQVGATMLGMTYEDVEKGKKVKGSPAKTARDAAKVFNFGAPGGLGAASLVDYARAGYGVTINEQQAREMKAQWLRAWPEMVNYFAWVNQAVGLGEAKLVHPITGFVRGDVGYTDGCNHLFQHLAAQGAKRALYRAAKEAYAEPDSAFYGSRPVVFVHDEIIAEVPEDRAAEASNRLATIMCEEMAQLISDVKITASPTLMRYWTKDAVETYDTDGTLVPWEKTR
jgi:DNA polymerase-1